MLLKHSRCCCRSTSRTLMSAASLALTIVVGISTVAISTPLAAEQPFKVARLTASNPDVNYFFGISVAVQDDTLVSLQMREIGDASFMAEALVYERSSPLSGWQRTRGFDVGPPAGFPISIALDDDRLVVGSLKLSDSAGVDSLVIHERHAGGTDNWGRVALLESPSPFDAFGSALDLEGDLLVVGAQGSGTTPPQPAYLFQHQEGGTWNVIARLPAASDVQGPYGKHVAISGTTILASSGASGFARAYLFEPDQGGLWQRIAEIDVSHPQGGYDPHGSIDGDRAVLKIFLPGNGAGSGVAIFERNAGGANQWGQVATTFFEPTTILTTLLAAGDSIYVGATTEEAGLRLNRQNDNDTHWPATAVFLPDPGELTGGFGEALAVDGSTIVFGTPYGGLDGGVAYVFIDPRFLDGFETGDTSAWTEVEEH